MLIVNNSKKPLPLSAGVVLYPGLPTDVADWHILRKLPVISAWLKAKIISEVVQPEPIKPHTQEAESAEKPYEVLAELEEHGVRKNRWTSLSRMQNLLAKSRQNNESAGQEHENDSSTADSAD